MAHGLATVTVALGLLASVALPSPPPAQAAPSHAALAQARAKLTKLVRHQQQLVEAYDGAMWKLQQVTSQLVQAQTDVQQQQALAAQAQEQADSAAALAYETSGSQLGVILGSTSLGELTDRMQFLATIQAQAVAAATQARNATARAQAAAASLTTLLQQRQTLLQTLSQKREEIKASVAAQRGIVNRMVRQIRKAERAAAAARLQQSLLGSPVPGGTVHLPPGLPSPPNKEAAAAISAAASVLGVPYVWGGADPKTGFDCSGLTMWAWAHAGVSMPHFAAYQYDMFPHVARQDLEPGDLVFFYPTVEHVGMYIGNGLMIDAPYTGTVVRVDPVDWSNYVGAARPFSG